jgi:alpha-L-fucosidase
MEFRFGDGRDWFFQKRFGLFIHWGLYAIDGWHEQMQHRQKMPRAKYARLARKFNPVKFDPDQWLDCAAQAGMDYLVFTSKHIDGFCLWDTQQTDYNVMRTPYGKDVLAMLAAACHKRGFPLCLYHSVISNHHPNYPNAGRPYELDKPEPGDAPDRDKYLDIVRKQLEELCTNYGEIAGIWWDCGPIGGNVGPVMDAPDPSFNEIIRRLQPKAVINNRGFTPGDFDTPERDWYGYVNQVLEFERPTEACNSIGVESWGYRKNEDYYSIRHLEESIAKILARGGNYLLNVGPTGKGEFCREARAMLANIGEWFNAVKESFYEAEPCTWLLEDDIMAANGGLFLARKGHSLYVILAGYPRSRRVMLKPIAVLPRQAVLLNTGKPVQVSVEVVPSCAQGYLRLCELPVDRMSGTVIVVRLDFDQFPFSDSDYAARRSAYREKMKTAKVVQAVGG